MKKLAIYIPSIESGGVEKNLYSISEYFLKKNIDLYIITANTNKKKFFNKKAKFICPKNNFWLIFNNFFPKQSNLLISICTIKSKINKSSKFFRYGKIEFRKQSRNTYYTGIYKLKLYRI